jgi:hypothetical protein
MYTYRIGNIKIEAENINELKELAEQLGEMAKESGMDLPKHLSDACFSIDVDYQRHHNLDEDNWDVVH